MYIYTHTLNQIKTKKTCEKVIFNKEEESLIPHQAKAPQLKIRVHTHT